MDVNFAAGRSAPHQPSPYPFFNVSQSKPYEKLYKLVLRSQDATCDGKTTYTFGNVSVPFEQIKGNCRLFLWNFVFSGTDNPSVAYNIKLEELTQQLSYDSRTGSTPKTLGTSYGFYFEATTADYGISLQDLSLFT
jgi:hypothetical protein